MTFRTTLTTAAAALGLLLAPAALAEGLLEKGKTEGFVLGFANEAPFAYTTPEGELAGVDADILRHVLGQLGIEKVSTELVEWGALIPGVRAKRFDVVASGIYMKPDRCEQVAFAEPLYLLGDGMIVLAGNPKNIHGFDAFANDPGLKLANTIGATGPGDHALAMGVTPEQILEVPDPPSQIAALKAGRVDAALNTGLQTGELVAAANDPAIERAEPFAQAVIDGQPAVGIAGIAFNPEDADFVELFDAELLKFRGTPEYLAILAKYGLTEGDLPAEGMTTDSVCAVVH
jgi:polar amino acid transport system substrate-binding protein